ncbi:unnamed protein product [Heligmosomoides polygyrus]|uniref:DUF5680 domain-containing protein n=1 Tax=Heligmosomoides polygyrus TaxID=6339 RepID=A0A183FHV0_HELPZ|nr:unnamed protein product [Heligmosomoides polygyrus]
MKIFERIMDGRIRNIARLSTMQCGFVVGCCTIDAIDALLDGPILKDKQDGKYEIVAVVRRTFLIEENPIFYFYTDYVMDWKKNPNDEKKDFTDLYTDDPFMFYELIVSVNDRIVRHVEFGGGKRQCNNAYLWIPDHGIYYLSGKERGYGSSHMEFITMYYFPHFFPQILS